MTNETEEKSFEEKSPLGQLFDDVSKDLFRTLAENYDQEFNKSELAEESERSRMALYKRWDVFEEYGIVENTEKQKYRLVKDSEVTEMLAALLFLEKDEDGEYIRNIPWEN